MSSTQRREQSRRNGAKAAGTKSPEGIVRSSQNSLKHGITAKAVVLPNESQEEFDQLRFDYIQRFQPQDTVEMDLVEEMVVARWRLRRLAGMQTAAFRLQLEYAEPEIKKRYTDIDDDSRNVIAVGGLANMHANRSSLLLRYETTNGRAYDRAMKDLERLQKNRPAPMELEAEEPETYKESPAAPQPVNPPASTRHNENCETTLCPNLERQFAPAPSIETKPYLLE